ncbi:MAG: ribosomal-protein-alanine N-acetyltransferase [Myxococcales bacterium]|nr:MAG: ribosomal-protein-alanine N-acetyltransferase [Myxococcales bacterium]
MTKISPASSDDLPALVAIAAECGLEVDFTAELSRSYARLLVAREAGVVNGFLLAWRAADELHLTDLGVTAARRRHGLARALVTELFREDSRVIFLEVRESNAPALALYGALGFTELDRRARYYSDTGEDAVVMQRLLR